MCADDAAEDDKALEASVGEEVTRRRGPSRERQCPNLPPVCVAAACTSLASPHPAPVQEEEEEEARCFWKMKTLPVDAEADDVCSVRGQRGQPTASVLPDRAIDAPKLSPSAC
jgi:hypothetical protein